MSKRRTRLYMWMIAWITLVICWMFSVYSVRIAFERYWYAIYTVISGLSLIIIVKTTRVRREAEK